MKVSLRPSYLLVLNLWHSENPVKQWGPSPFLSWVCHVSSLPLNLGAWYHDWNLAHPCEPLL